MILGLDTSTPVCRVTVNGKTSEWEAGRRLARGLLAYLRDRLRENDATFADITGIVVFRGPGSFTGLRIGITVVNTIADAQSIPLVGQTGEDWYAAGERRLAHGDDDRIILPLYGSAPHITRSKK